MESDPLCHRETVAALRCFVHQPLPAWECGEDGVASMREGYCDAEQRRAVECFATATNGR
jgi:hypothetical protein